MGNTLKIATNEFVNLANNKGMAIIIMFYLVIFISSTYYHYSIQYKELLSDPVDYLLADLMQDLSYYGSLIAIIIGYFSISNEINNNTLSLLMTKPAYRDTIINGKLVGILCFVSCFIIVAIALQISLILIVFGGLVGDNIGLLMAKLPVVYFFTMLCFVFFISIAVFFATLFKEKNIALFMSYIVWLFVMLLMPNMIIAGYIGDYLGTYGYNLTTFISGLSPSNMVNIIFNSDNAIETITNHGYDFLILSIYSITALVFSYITLIRRDIS